MDRRSETEGTSAPTKVVIVVTAKKWKKTRFPVNDPCRRFFNVSESTQGLKFWNDFVLKKKSNPPVILFRSQHRWPGVRTDSSPWSTYCYYYWHSTYYWSTHTYCRTCLLEEVRITYILWLKQWSRMAPLLTLVNWVMLRI